jgi:hypothetical protein
MSCVFCRNCVSLYYRSLYINQQGISRNFPFIRFLLPLFILHFLPVSRLSPSDKISLSVPRPSPLFLYSEFCLYPLHRGNIGSSLSAGMAGPWQLSLRSAVKYTVWNPKCVIGLSDTEFFVSPGQ